MKIGRYENRAKVFVFVFALGDGIRQGWQRLCNFSPPRGSNGLMSSPERKLMRKGVMTSPLVLATTTGYPTNPVSLYTM